MFIAKVYMGECLHDVWQNVFLLGDFAKGFLVLVNIHVRSVQHDTIRDQVLRTIIFGTEGFLPEAVGFCMNKFPMIIRCVGLVILALISPLSHFIASAHNQGPRILGDQDILATPTATPDFINIPEVPENPSQVDLGRDSYWYNCMPCHGDHGQGLTEAWRLTWPEDHRECWNRGCHGGRLEDEGFPIPKFVPTIFDSSYMQKRFPNQDDLFGYLSLEHPPQSPGSLEQDDYWALTAYLLFETGQVSEEVMLGSITQGLAGESYGEILIVGLGILASIFSGLWFWTRSQLQKH